VIGKQINQRGGNTVHGDRVPVSQGRQASFNAAIRAENVQITYATFDAQPGVLNPTRLRRGYSLILRCPRALSGEAFYVVIAARQLDAPTLTVADLDQVVSAEASILRTVEDEMVKYRIEITLPSPRAQPSALN